MTPVVDYRWELSSRTPSIFARTFAVSLLGAGLFAARNTGAAVSPSFCNVGMFRP